MDVLDKEILLFWNFLNKYNVRYIMVGGVASSLYGYPDTLDSIDIWIEDTVENRRNLRLAFKEYGMGDFSMMEKMQLVPGWTNFNLNNGLRLHVMGNIKGLEDFSFDECLQLASIAEIYDVKVPFLHINHLIAAKKAANRPKDQIDVIYLEKIKKLKEALDNESNP